MLQNKTEANTYAAMALRFKATTKRPEEILEWLKSARSYFSGNYPECMFVAL